MDNGDRFPSPPPSPRFQRTVEERAPTPTQSVRHDAGFATSPPAQDREQQIHQTSAALQAAYERLRQVRRNLLELSETLPVALAQLRFQVPENQNSPDHDAPLTPALGTNDYHSEGQSDGGDAREVTPWTQIHFHRSENNASSGSSMTESHRLSGRGSDLGFENAFGYDTPNAGSATGDPRASARFRLIPPRHGMEAQGDDGSTLIGRRVTSRLAGSPMISDRTTNGIQSMGEIGQVYEGTLNMTTGVTRSYRERESALGALDESRRNSSTLPLLPAVRRVSALVQTLSQLSSQGPSQHPSQTPPTTSTNPHQDDTMFTEIRQNSAPSERPSLLSNLSVENFSTPLTPNPSVRPLVFGESSSYVQSSERGSNNNPNSQIVFEGRHYVVSRTYNRHGEERVHNITVDWDDDDRNDPFPWIMPSRTTPATSQSRRQRIRSALARQARHNAAETARIMESPAVPQESSSTAPRRRGWARLDMDGNEIPLHEEEELERIRTENRLRASQSSQAHAPSSTVVDKSGNANTSESEPQVIIYHAVDPPTVLRQEPKLMLPPDFVYPLPMPLSEMILPSQEQVREPLQLTEPFFAGR